ncbi:MAG: E3 ubiquitin protein ligase [Asgard group archaeon]|nr:E3 ubiquitin protein ligase [Asgard group archaeon]
MRKDKKFLILFFVGFAILTTGIILRSFYWENYYTFIPIIAGVIMISAVAIIYRYRRKPLPDIMDDQAPASSEEYRLKAEELYRQRVENAIQKALGKKKEIPLEDKNILAVEFKGACENEICMICKLFLKSNDSILQCPTCESLYHTDHLLTWIKSKQRCPVCSEELYHKETSK